MKIPAPAPSDVDPPPRGVVAKFLRIARPGRLSLAALAKTIGSVSDAKVFATQAVAHALLFRLDRGVYAAPSPDVGFLSWTFPRYFRELVAMSNALDHAGVAHGFACLAALSSGADYVPAVPFAVLAEPEAHSCPALPAFHVQRFSARPVRLDTAGSGFRLTVPAVDTLTAAKVLAAAGLPREAGVARALVRGKKLTRRQAAEFNGLGLRLRNDVLGVASPTVVVPPFLDRERKRFADQARLRQLEGEPLGA